MEQSKTSGGDQVLRTSTLIRDRPDRGEEQEVLWGESDGLSSPNPLRDDSTRDDAEAKKDFWSITEDSLIVIASYPELNCTCREKNHFVFRWSTSTLPEQHIRHWMYCWKSQLMITGTWMEKENCQMHGQASKDLIYKKERPFDGCTLSVRKLHEETNTSRPDVVWPGMRKFMSDAAKKKAKQR